MLSGLCYGLAAGAHLVLVAWLVRRYPELPPRFPWSTLPTGEVLFWGPPWVVFVGPAIVIATLVALPVLFATIPAHGPPPRPAFFALLWLIYAETAGVLYVVLGYQIEVALGKRRRVPVGRTLLLAAPLLATVAALALTTKP